jgi:methionine sulfoxide reductase heme-binding subunit
MTIWYIARGAGLAALLLLTISTCIGAVMTGRGKPASRVVVQYLHRVTASLGLGALVLHVSTILADSYAHVGWKAAIIPFTSAYRPTWVGLGTLAIYTFVLVAALGFARGRFAASQRAAAIWRWLHSLAYVGWGMAMLHGLNSGTDSSVGWVRWLYVACGAGVLASVAVRFGFAKRVDLVRGSAARPVTMVSR